ncbi:MAG: 3-deoxy-D-manno-octulosonic acid transferase [Rhodospirillales bacterium]|nr:3-deoxy-D-manno-octulosonic acid transferase [Rhodospirillales bacterium]
MITTTGGPLIRAYLSFRLYRGKEHPERFGERLGIAALSRPRGPLIWVHAASVGECLSVLPLVDRLNRLEPRPRVMVTSGTVTSAELMSERLPDGAFHQFLPVDRIRYVRRFLDHWRPNAVLWAESEFWPNLVQEISGRKIPLILVNGRISDRSYARWQRYPRTIARILAHFELCMGQTETDTERLRTLGARDVACLGNLKHAAPPLPANAEKLEDSKRAMSGRRVWLAASTHEGEEERCGRVHQKLRVDIPRLLTIIVPRHPQRGDEIADALGQMDLSVSLRSRDQSIDEKTDIYIADTIGELGIFFRLAELAFIGKSLVPLGGQNPFEAACLGCPALFGPHMSNFRDMARHMTEIGAAAEVSDDDALAETVARLFSDEKKRKAMGQAGLAFAKREAGVIDRVVDEISPFLVPALGRGEDHASS